MHASFSFVDADAQTKVYCWYLLVVYILQLGLVKSDRQSEVPKGRRSGSDDLR
jgi:hypothetical protein